MVVINKLNAIGAMLLDPFQEAELKKPMVNVESYIKKLKIGVCK